MHPPTYAENFFERRATLDGDACAFDVPIFNVRRAAFRAISVPHKPTLAPACFVGKRNGAILTWDFVNFVGIG
jgi:hypothetical protein